MAFKPEKAEFRTRVCMRLGGPVAGESNGVSFFEGGLSFYRGRTRRLQVPVEKWCSSVTDGF
jgi:hypothetical protein